MQQFTVPQFIDVEDKIIGPITTRQFLIILVACVLIFIFYKILDFAAFIATSVLTAGIGSVFAFVKVNGMPFHFFVLNFIQTTKRANLRVWNNEFSGLDVVVDAPVEKMKKQDKFFAPEAKKPYSASRLAELSLIVDTQGSYKGPNKQYKEPEELDLGQETVSV